MTFLLLYKQYKDKYVCKVNINNIIMDLMLIFVEIVTVANY